MKQNDIKEWRNMMNNLKKKKAIRGNNTQTVPCLSMTYEGNLSEYDLIWMESQCVFKWINNRKSLSIFK